MQNNKRKEEIFLFIHIHLSSKPSVSISFCLSLGLDWNFQPLRRRCLLFRSLSFLNCNMRYLDFFISNVLSIFKGSCCSQFLYFSHNFVIYYWYWILKLKLGPSTVRQTLYHWPISLVLLLLKTLANIIPFTPDIWNHEEITNPRFWSDCTIC